MLPYMYKENRDNPIFTVDNFLLTLLKGSIHCIINFYIIIFVFNEQSFDKKGNIPELWILSVCLYTNILLIVTGDLMIYTKYHTWLNFFIIGIKTVLLYIGFIILVHNWSFFNSVDTMVNTFNRSKIWLLFIFIFGTCFLIDFTILACNFTFEKKIVIYYN